MPRDKLMAAIANVETLCEWLEEKMFDAKYLRPSRERPPRRRVSAGDQTTTRKRPDMTAKKLTISPTEADLEVEIHRTIARALPWLSAQSIRHQTKFSFTFGRKTAYRGGEHTAIVRVWQLQLIDKPLVAGHEATRYRLDHQLLYLFELCHASP